MSRIVIALLSFLFLVPQGLRATPQLQQFVISNVAPSTTSCSAPPLVTTFSATDTAAYVYFAVTGVNAQDTFTVAFYGPSGQLYTGSGGQVSFTTQNSGNGCYPTTNAPLLIAGNPAATMPGTWTVAIFYNNNFNTAFATGTFTITAASTSSTVYYRFENGTAGATATGSGSIVDSMGNQNGTPSGTVTYSSDVPLSTVGGAANKLSLQLATNGSVQFPGAFPLNTLANATLEFYIKPANTGLMYFLWTRTDSTDANRFNMVTNGSGVDLDYREPNGTRHLLTPTPIAIASTGWTHVAVVKSGNVWTSYANGVQQGPAFTDTNPNLPTNTGWTLNGSNLNQQFAGLLDELRISDTVLTPSQFLSPVSAAACTYTLSTSSASPGPGASSNNSFNVTAASGCTWTATSNAQTWLTTSSSGNGSGPVNYSVTANTSTSSRTGIITVSGPTSAGAQTFTVTQAGASGGGGTTTGNLIQNGGAESGPTNSFSGEPNIPGWTTDGNVAVVAYTDPRGDFTSTSQGPPNCGNNYFAGGAGNAVSKMSQTINLSSYATAIDTGAQGYTLDGWLGGWDGDDDNAVVTVTFLSASGATLGTGSIGPVVSADRGGVTELLERTTSGTVPIGTRSALIGVTFTRANGSDNDGMADNLSFVLGGGGSTATGNYDPAANFATSPPANPSGVWSYGYETKLGSGFTLYRYVDSSGIGGITAWEYAQGPFGQGTVLPAVAKNTTASTITSGSIQVPTNVLLLHPGPSDQYSIVRFTAPAAGSYSISGSFSGLDSVGPTTTDVHILQNGSTSLFSNNVSAFGAGPAFSVTPTLNAGDTIDFAVGYGSNNNYSNDSTGLKATITQGGGTTGTSVYYRFENGTAGATAAGSGSIVDSMGNQNGTPSGTVTYSSDVPLSTLGGAANKLSLQLATNGSVQFPGAFPLNSLTNATLEFYVKPTGTGSQMFFLWTRTDSTDANRFNMGVINGNSIGFDYREPNGTWHIIFPGGGPLQIPNAGWSHVAIVKSGNVWTGYINGVQMGQPVTDANPNLPTNTGWTLNGSNLGQFAGLLDEIRISNSALTPSQFLPPVSGATGTCGYSFSPPIGSVLATQSTGSVTVTVTSGSGCSWTAVSNTTWIHVTSGASGTGGGVVGYSVDANTGAARSGTMTIAGQTYTINQAAASGGPPAGCNYYVSPLSQSQPATPATSGGNITGLIMVNTGPNCAWTAVSNNSWITVVSGGGSTSGAVSYKVDPNTASTSRQGTMTVAWQTVTVLQAAGVACTYSITPTSNNMQATGGSSSIAVGVTAGSNCSWTASVSSSAASWLHLGSTTSGTTNGSVSYTADANTTTASRIGTIAINNLTFTLTQAGGASANGPTMPQGGIVNAVNYRANIAQGSFFAIFGQNLGPAQYVQNNVFPIPKVLGGVSVNVTQGSITKAAPLVFVSATQINGIMPSDAPLGTVQVTVNYNGSGSATANVVQIAFGINSTAGGSGPGIINNYNSATDQPLNLASIPGKPGQTEVMVGTGLGPLPAGTGDDQPFPGGAPATPVQVWVGTKQAKVDYSGRAPYIAGQDQINFEVPNDAPTGCSVPVQVNAGGTWSNTVRMAISTDGKHCQDSFSPFGNVSSTGGNTGTIGLIRLKFNGQSVKTGGPINAALDLGIGAFVKNRPGGDVAYSPLTNLPPPGACSSTNTKADQGTVTSNIFGIDPTIASTLDAGAQLTVTGGAGGASGTMTQSLGSANPYAGLLGGILNTSSSTTVPPPFLDGGPFTVSGPGGNDVGPFTTNIALTPAIAWTNPPSTINRASPLTLTWTGGDSTEVVVIGGSSTDQTSKAYGGFTCVAPAGAHSFTVPVNTLADLIPVGVATSSTGAFGMLLLMPLEPGSMQFTPLPKGLDVGVVFDTTATMQQVQVQ